MSELNKEQSSGIDEETEICFSILLAAVKELGQKIDARFDRLENRLDASKLVEDLKEENKSENK